ncbi:TetR/AcrR family transcriptional regulator [Putridiphycobacter roseus]|uniref:TetR/AcrR family transcriptional regulator n=1 Tax=Putridiphycobacter roseus TaxID=2219161 RepID=A0A2W1N5U9_9FLAO|nr:TetR/AcrR family transcriptional regulator [Putridiphycobacter roseus]PZE18531.1 TetR/AcrR family transcriptional regulator [Putridiphycobacter roseus]
MPTKAAQTKVHIIKTVAPVFNKQGYFGTSLKDITIATALTKGAIYGNFKDKNELALEAFKYNVNIITSKIEAVILQKHTAIEKLFAIAEFYADYYRFTFKYGGCPILNIGIDANHQNEVLLQKVRKAIDNIQNNISKIIQFGIQEKEINPTIDADYYARQIFARIEGAVFMTMTTKNEIYMKDMSIGLKIMIDKELIA